MAKAKSGNTAKEIKPKSVKVPNWSKAVSPSNNFMKVAPGKSGTGKKHGSK